MVDPSQTIIIIIIVIKTSLFTGKIWISTFISLLLLADISSTEEKNDTFFYKVFNISRHQFRHLEDNSLIVIIPGGGN